MHRAAKLIDLLRSISVAIATHHGGPASAYAANEWTEITRSECRQPNAANHPVTCCPVIRPYIITITIQTLYTQSNAPMMSYGHRTNANRSTDQNKLRPIEMTYYDNDVSNSFAVSIA